MTDTLPIPAFHEEWFGQASCDTLARLVTEVADVPGALIEIGSWEGRSTIAMANAAHPRTVHAVDTWEGSPGEVSSELAARRDVWAQWNVNVRHFARGNITPYRFDWREFVEILGRSPVALVFIDAEHTYAEVRDTIAAFLPLMSPGGIVCGDDVHHPPIIEAVTEHFGADGFDRDATLWIVQL